jgi:tripartite-type tricarboxylate transporter receptor subunit TctC
MVCRLLFVFALAATSFSAAVAQSTASQPSYPTRPIRLIVPFAPGGGSDLAGRLLAESIAPALRQTVVIDNRPGAGSSLGSDIASKSAPDGYTLLLGNISLAFNAALYKKLPFDAVRDLATISLAADQPSIMVTPPSLPAKSLQEFIALVRSQPGKLTYGSAGLGSGTHLAMELLLLSQKLDMVHVPYKGTGPVITALLGNEIGAFLSTFAPALPHIKTGRMRGIAVTSLKRAPTLPEVPTVAESGIPGFEYATWYGVLAPARTPKPVIDKLNKTIVAALNSPELQQRYSSQGMDPKPTPSAEFAAYLKSETEKWAKVVRDAKIPQQ